MRKKRIKRPFSSLFSLLSSTEAAFVTTHANGTQIYPRLFTPNKKHQMYTSIEPYILFTLTAFQQLLFPMQMTLSHSPMC